MCIIGGKLCGFYSSYIHAEGIQNTHKSESNLHEDSTRWLLELNLKKFARSFLPLLFQG